MAWQFAQTMARSESIGTTLSTLRDNEAQQPGSGDGVSDCLG
jgi:hypothetical protein